MQGTMPGSRRQGRPRTAWMDNIKTWTGLSVEESVRMTEDGESMPTVWPTLGSRTAKEQKEENYYYHRPLVFFHCRVLRLMVAKNVTHITQCGKMF